MGDFIDTHAEAMCQQMEEQGVEPIKTAAESAIPSSCAAVPSLPADECANCASNGLQEAQETQSKDFIEACAAATKNMINDTDAASNFYNHSIPAFCGFALVSAVAGLVIVHRARRNVRDEEIATALQDEEMMELNE